MSTSFSGIPEAPAPAGAQRTTNPARSRLMSLDVRMRSISTRAEKVKAWNDGGRTLGPALRTDMDLITAGLPGAVDATATRAGARLPVTVPFVLVSVNVSGEPPEPAEVATIV